jgi:hypothetical protein
MLETTLSRRHKDAPTDLNKEPNMKFKTLAVALLLSGLASSAFALEKAPTSPEVEAKVEVEPKISCLLGLPENLDAQIILSSTETHFSIFSNSSTGHTIDTVYEKSPVAILMAPVEAPYLECTSEESMIMVWDNLAFVNGQYFRIDNATVYHGI